MEYKELIKTDLFRYTAGNKIPILSKIRLYGWNYTKTWRKANHYKYNKLLYFVWGCVLYKKSLKYGFQISPRATIGKGLYLGHFGTIIVGNEVVIGDNCNLSPNVVIGKANRGFKEGSPQIGNSVWIGSGAVIVGRIKIGNNVLIAPNSYVNFDVPDNSIVVGNPAIVHPSKNATERYIENIVE